MANTILTPKAVTREALRVLHQKLNFISTVTRDYDDRFAQTGAKIGDTLSIRLPNQYLVTDGPIYNGQDTTERVVDLKVTSQKHVGMNFTDAEMTLSLDDFRERIIEPAMSVLAAKIEGDVLANVYKDVYQQVNNTGASATFAKVLQGRKMLVDALAPPDKRTVALNTQDNVDMVDALKGLFNDQKTIGKQNTEGYLGRTSGFDFNENTLLPSHTRGGANGSYTTDTRTSAIPVSATPVTSITVASGSGGGVKGDIFTIDGVFRVHPETKVSTGVKQQFAVTADFASTTVGITPSIITAGALQNVVIPTGAATAALSWAGTASTAHGISLAYQKGAFAFATADLFLPKGVDMAEREEFEGISIRLLRDFDTINSKLITRVDVLYGFKTIRPELAARLANN